MKRFSFPKNKRLTSSQFESVLARKNSARDDLLVVYAAKNDSDRPRLGISVGKSSGPAVVRNRLKRLLREAFRQNQDKIPAGFDYLIMISPQWTKQTGRQSESKAPRKMPAFEQITASLLSLAKQAAKANNKRDNSE